MPTTSYFINVKSAPWNAVGDGTTHDTVAINNAFVSASSYDRAVIYFPPGNYYLPEITGPPIVTPKLQVTSAGHVDVIGDAPGAVSLTIPKAYSGIEFLPSGGTFQQGSVKNIEIYYSVSADSGTYGVHLQNCSEMWIEDVLVTGGDVDFFIEGASGNDCSDIHILGCRASKDASPASDASGLVIKGSNSSLTQEIHVTDCTFGGNGSAAPGILLENCSGLWFTSCSTQGFEVGLQVSPGSGQKVYNANLVQSNFDASVTNGIYLNPSSGGLVYEFHFSNCYSGYSSTGYGVHIQPADTSSAVYDIVLDGHRTAGNKSDGLFIDCPASGTIQRITVTGGYYSANASTYAGIRIGGPVSNALISGASIQPTTHEHAGGPQTYGIVMQAASSQDPTNVTVVGCDLTGYATNDAVTYVQGTTLSNAFTSNNGFNPVGKVTPPANPPVNGTSYTNPFPFPVDVYVVPSAQIKITITGPNDSTGIYFQTSTAVMVTLQAEETIDVSWTGSPTVNWTWKGA